MACGGLPSHAGRTPLILSPTAFPRSPSPLPRRCSSRRRRWRCARAWGSRRRQSCDGVRWPPMLAGLPRSCRPPPFPDPHPLSYVALAHRSSAAFLYGAGIIAPAAARGDEEAAEVQGEIFASWFPLAGVRAASNGRSRTISSTLAVPLASTIPKSPSYSVSPWMSWEWRWMVRSSRA
jgi:hypothetical protein